MSEPTPGEVQFGLMNEIARLMDERANAQAEITRLKQAIELAPHGGDCTKVVGWQGVESGLLKCNCWKSQIPPGGNE